MSQPQILELAQQLVIGIAPFVAGGALAKLGEHATDGVEAFARRAWGALAQRFQGNKKAESALVVFEDEADKPASQDRVVQQIVAIYQNDPVAIAELQALVAELQRIQPTPPPAQRSHTQHIGGKARVGVAIAGDNHGNISTGTGDNINVGDISNSSGIAIGRGARTINTGGGDYAEGNIDKSRRVIIGSQPKGTPILPTAASDTTRGELPATLSADGVHFSYGYALLIGVGQYLSKEHTAPTTANDASQLAALLTDQQIAAYPADQVTLLTNQAATRQGILDAFASLTERLKAAQHAPEKPTVVVFYAGHGSNSNGNFALLPHDYDPSNRSATTLSDRAFRNAIQALIPYCQKLLVLLNCCYAGGTAGQVLSAGGSGGLSSAAPPRSYIETLTTGSGQVVISSSRSDQPSSAIAEDNQQLTTFGSKLIAALRGKAKGDGPAVGVLDVFGHLASAVPADARGISYQGKPLTQQPLLYVREVDQNFPVALRPIDQQRGTLDADMTDDIQRLAQIELDLFAYEHDEDAPGLVAEREAIVRKLSAK